jgi:outer membrane protein OmpA-like peptidoglycan-associated protein
MSWTSNVAEDFRMHDRILGFLSCFALATIASLAAPAAAQDAPQPQPQPAAKSFPSESPSRWDIFAGYSYLAPKGTVNVLQTDGVTVLPQTYKSMDQGLLLSGTYFFNKYVGAQVESGLHDVWKNSSSSNGGAYTLSGGLLARFPTADITPFIHGMVGAARMNGPQHEPWKWGPALTVGGGMDYATPLFDHHLGIRLFQADFEYMHVNWGPGELQGRGNFNSARLSAGLVYHVGSIAPPPQLTVACSASPTSVFPGEPVTVTLTPGSQDPKLNLITSISGDGIEGTANGATATVNTANLTPGQHTVKCDAKEGKRGKEGLKPWQVATQSTASFTVKEFEPPTISCSVSPTTIKPGDSATITSTAASPQNRPLTYTYSASAGSVTGTGASATYASTGAPTGQVSITCNVADDKGHSASSNTSLTILAPPPPPQPHTQALCSITFETDKARPTRVDNEAKACLDQVALSLQNQSDAKAVVVGHSNAKEKDKMAKQQKLEAKHRHPKPVEDPAAQRAVNTKDYLVKEKGIDASRISVATSTTDGQNVEDYLVPAGASFDSDVQGTTPVDETTVKPQTRKPLPQRHHHRAAASK